MRHSGRKNVRRVRAVGEGRLCNCSRSCLPVASWSSRLVLRPWRNYRPIFAVCSPMNSPLSHGSAGAFAAVLHPNSMRRGAEPASRTILQPFLPLPSEPSARRRSWRGLLERAGASSVQTWQRFCFYGHSCRFRLKLPGPVGVYRFRHQSVRVCLVFPSSKSINQKRVQVAGKIAKSLAGFIEPMECLPVPKLPTGGGWLYEILCDGSHKSSCVAQEVMLRNNSGSAHLLAGALRARNIISRQR